MQENITQNNQKMTQEERKQDFLKLYEIYLKYYYLKDYCEITYNDQNDFDIMYNDQDFFEHIKHINNEDIDIIQRLILIHHYKNIITKIYKTIFLSHEISLYRSNLQQQKMLGDNNSIINIHYINKSTIKEIGRHLGISTEILKKTSNKAVVLSKNMIRKTKAELIQEQINDINVFLEAAKKEDIRDSLLSAPIKGLKEMRDYFIKIKPLTKTLTRSIILLSLKLIKFSFILISVIFKFIIKPLINIPSRICKYFTSKNNENSFISER
ncbi:hypothetical protein [Lyticum sinuosum]|uniref:Uncharacterized protein n=1 Tax=Lyticum sinuosum TaxID=1332059 RepID=A0AAE5AHE4_9RICK|nr:hypothetical protein [Lyticum sinuosum]MDZ5761475.1 hypothetical protein [Lyticum sinuosum]